MTELAMGVLADPDELAVLGDLPQLRKLALKGWSRVDLAVLAGREDLVVEVGFSTSVQNEDRLGERSRVEREDPPPRRILPRRRYRPC
jgi:hypothetical protein